MGEFFVKSDALEVIDTVGATLSKVYTAVETGDANPTWSQVITFNVVVAAGMDTVGAGVVKLVPEEHVGSVPLVV